MNNETFVNKILQNVGIKELNEMQQTMLKRCQAGRDIILLSPTGSGKTLAFLIPLVMSVKTCEQATQALIVTPSRELALQIEHVLKSMGSGVRVGCLYGGHNMLTEENLLKNPPHVIVGTPGRLCDHIDAGRLKTDTIKTLVLDEFDKSLEFGFTDEMKHIAENLRAVKLKMLISATEAVEIPSFTGLRNPSKVNFLEKDESLKKLKIRKVMSPQKDKLETLLKLICTLGNKSTLIFCNHRDAVDRVAVFLEKQGVVCQTFHGGMEQIDRERSLCLFRNGSRYVMISTDLAARGLDIPEIQNVIHYHLPTSEEAFTHRNGRTARMFADGSAFVILNEADKIPDFITNEMEEFLLDENARLPKKPEWETLYIGKGKRDKISRSDVAGFMFQKGALLKEEFGLIEVKEKFSLVAVKSELIKELLKRIEGQKIKGQKTKFEIAK